MPKPDGGLIRENNFQYYAGAQILYTSVAATTIYDFTFNTKLVLGSPTSYAPTDPDYGQNNFRIFTSPNGLNNYTEFTTAYTITYIEQGYKTVSRITLGAAQNIGTYIKVQLKEEAGVFKNEAVLGYEVYGCEDWEFWLRIFNQGARCHILSDILVRNYQDGTTMSGDAVKMALCWPTNLAPFWEASCLICWIFVIKFIS